MTRDDQALMEELLGDPDVMRYYPAPKTSEQVERWIESTLRHYSEHGYALWVLERLEDGAFIGECGLIWQTVEGERMLEVGYHLLPRYQGKGYATEAARACAEFASNQLGVTHLIAMINPQNEPSRRVAERIGMGIEKTVDVPDGREVLIYGRDLASL